MDWQHLDSTLETRKTKSPDLTPSKQDLFARTLEILPKCLEFTNYRCKKPTLDLLWVSIKFQLLWPTSKFASDLILSWLSLWYFSFAALSFSRSIGSPQTACDAFLVSLAIVGWWCWSIWWLSAEYRCLSIYAKRFRGRSEGTTELANERQFLIFLSVGSKFFRNGFYGWCRMNLNGLKNGTKISWPDTIHRKFLITRIMPL